MNFSLFLHAGTMEENRFLFAIFQKPTISFRSGFDRVEVGSSGHPTFPAEVGG
jgi:hypothetical protein